MCGHPTSAQLAPPTIVRNEIGLSWLEWVGLPSSAVRSLAVAKIHNQTRIAYKNSHYVQPSPCRHGRRRVEMRLPAFAAEAALYKTKTSYRGFGGITPHGGALTVVPADANSDCIALFLTAAEVAAEACATSVFGIGPCIASVVFATGANICTCPPSGGGGGGGPPTCCPPGTTCRCGGTCQRVNGRLACWDGKCLGPRELCP